MIRSILALVLLVQEGPLVSSMDDVKVTAPKEKGRTESVEGKVGKAVKFSFDDKCKSAFCITNIRATPEWDKAAGFSFWVKGDGSKHFGALQLIWNEDYAARYDVAFPIDGTEWKKIVVAWRDLVPVLPGPTSRFIDPKSGNAPSKLGSFWFGKWWYWRDASSSMFWRLFLNSISEAARSLLARATFDDRCALNRGILISNPTVRLLAWKF